MRLLAIHRAQTHALAALKRHPDDATLHILMGRIAMLEHHNTAARKHFEDALNLNVAPGQILPYLAETRFRVGDFAALGVLARDFPSLLDLPNIGPVVRFWTKTI
ncbi:MAG: tetratricopeptide repeat protein [Acidiferrobacter sp.]